MRTIVRSDQTHSFRLLYFNVNLFPKYKKNKNIAVEYICCFVFLFYYSLAGMNRTYFFQISPRYVPRVKIRFFFSSFASFFFCLCLVFLLHSFTNQTTKNNGLKRINNFHFIGYSFTWFEEIAVLNRERAIVNIYIELCVYNVCEWARARSL